jgi:hypothetical protein
MVGSFAITSAALVACRSRRCLSFGLRGGRVAIGVPAGLHHGAARRRCCGRSRASGMGVFFTCYFVADGCAAGARGPVRDISGSPRNAGPVRSRDGAIVYARAGAVPRQAVAEQ